MLPSSARRHMVLKKTNLNIVTDMKREKATQTISIISVPFQVTLSVDSLLLPARRRLG